jgi:HD-GYP domain-containing protein (c-di-GMP phosphodiesterase class II)
VGKISIPDKVLMKPGALSEEEFEIMKSHVENALHILKDIRSLPPRVFEMVLYHHERYDGGGYPHGLKGEEIPLGAQIIGLADTFDAMTSDRPYRKGFSADEALNRMEEATGTQFNPRLLKAFFGLFEFRAKKPLTLNLRQEKGEGEG